MAQQLPQIATPVSPTCTDKETRFTDLDDACLLMVFKHLMPLPDLFCCAQTCWRFHRLTSDKRMWLVVAPSHIPPEHTPSGRAGVIYSNLKAAVAASRPGDTIWLAPGMVHEAADINIPHPLHILGGGLNPEDTQLIAPVGADCALSFSASCKVAMLAVSATLCACLVHKKGLLTVERCKLSSDPRGLLHLVSPVVTLAASSSATTGTAAGLAAAVSAAGTVELAVAVLAKLPGLSSSSSSSSNKALPRQPRPRTGTGRLVIVECRLQGGSTAVRCSGTGRLRDVRVIYESRAAFFWLEVDSADPGSLLPQQQQQQDGVLMQYSLLQQQQQQQDLLAKDYEAAVARHPQHQQQLEVLRFTRSKEWQQCRAKARSSTTDSNSCCAQQQQQGVADGGALTGLARIQSVLGKRVNPTMLAAHLGARKQLQPQTD